MDIADSFTRADKTAYELIEYINKLITKENSKGFKYADTDMYIQKIIEYFYDVEFGNIVSKEAIYLIDINPAISVSTLSSDLAMILFEKAHTENFFLISPSTMNTSNIDSFLEANIILEEMIDAGLIPAIDVVNFIDRDTSIALITKYILTTNTLIVDNNLPKDNILFLGWKSDGIAIFLNFNSKEMGNE